MKESGVEWIGKIPENWNVTKLKYLFSESIAGEVIDKSYWNDGDEILYTCQKTPIYSNYLNFPERKRTKDNDLLLTRNATPYIFIPEPNSIYSNVVQKITLNKNLSKNYIKYALLSGVNSLQVNGDTIPSWNMEVWSNISVPIMKMNEQQRIAKFIDQKIIQIDHVIEKTKETIEDYKKYKQAMITKTITKGINKNDNFIDSNNEWMGKISSKAKLKKIKYLCNISRGLFNHRPRNDERYYNGPYPFIQTGDVARAQKYITTYSQTLNELGIGVSKLFPKGTLTMTIAANVGDVAILDFDSYFPDSVLGFVPNNNINNMYLYYIFKCMKQEFINASIVSTQLNLNIDRVKELVVPIFEDINYQKEIVKYLENKCEYIDNLVENKTKIIEELEQYKKSLIYEYVTGKKEVI